MNARVIVIALALVAASARADEPDRPRILSEKLASDLRESRRCETNPDNGYLQCHYQYQGLRFTRRVVQFPSGPLSHVEVESVSPQEPVTVSFSGVGPCFQINITSDNLEDVAAAMMNVSDGRISADGREIGCFPKAARKGPRR